uniref:Uncharacterized protein n=1 Tax=Heterorhabditis bacteriophora TaxID=37862 RepID=A0A1I7WSS2_HETBA
MKTCSNDLPDPELTTRVCFAHNLHQLLYVRLLKHFKGSSSETQSVVDLPAGAESLVAVVVAVLDQEDDYEGQEQVLLVDLKTLTLHIVIGLLYDDDDINDKVNLFLILNECLFYSLFLKIFCYEDLYF